MKLIFMSALTESGSATLSGTIFRTNKELEGSFSDCYKIYLQKSPYIIYKIVICICLFNTWHQGDISSWSDRMRGRRAQEYTYSCHTPSWHMLWKHLLWCFWPVPGFCTHITCLFSFLTPWNESQNIIKSREFQGTLHALLVLLWYFKRGYLYLFV